MARYGVALDLGTSGVRGHGIDLDSSRIVSTAITGLHPLPGANVMDHLHFAVETSTDGRSRIAHELIVDTVNKVLDALEIPLEQVVRVALCGNPIQLSLFQAMEIRDLAYAGERKRASLGVEVQTREARIGSAGEIEGLRLPPEAELVVPPAVRHEVGADALAMMLESGMLERDEIALVTDYGTNAEMALKVGDRVITGSAACGPAFEGQAIRHGMLAAPGAVSDLERCDGREHWGSDDFAYLNLVLDENMLPTPGQVVDPRTGSVREAGAEEARGITGTGVMAAIARGIEDGLLERPSIATPDGLLHLSNRITLNAHDVGEVGKAVGAARAGHVTLAAEAGIELDDIRAAYMAGASGTYVDARKAQEIGMVPASASMIYQIGNTSLMLARRLVLDRDLVWEIEAIARSLRASHCMFADAPVFKQVYVLELSYWGEGMPWSMYLKFMERSNLPTPREYPGKVEVRRLVERDIPDLGERGLAVVRNVGLVMVASFEGCTECETCFESCPEGAISLSRDSAGNPLVMVDSARCLGLSCLRCELNCPEKVFRFADFLRTLER